MRTDAAITAEPMPRPASFSRDFSALTKPRITLMVVLTTAVGYLLATPAFDVPTLAWTLLGTALLASGSSVFNQVIERKIDARMVRTAQRPLPAGRMGTPAAMALGLGLTLAGMVLLMALVNLLTAALGVGTLLLYVLAYTPLKPISSLSTLVGAVPGAMPPLMGVAAAVEGLPIVGWLLFGILFLWQMPHFLAIAWLYKDDYQRGGLPMLSVGDLDGRTARQAVLYAATLLPVGLLPSVFGVTGGLFFWGAVLLGLAYLGASFRFSRQLDARAARQLLLVSVAYLPLVLGLMVLDRQ
jgi:protoheme IX farnesyltransferase